MSDYHWIYDTQPQAAGMYAVRYCYEMDEGVLSGVALWNGRDWYPAVPVVAFAGPFANSAAAASTWLMQQTDNAG